MGRHNTAVIGTGYIGNAHIEALGRAGQNICAVVDANKNACRKVADKYGIAGVYTDYIEMMDIEDIEAVHICTPNHMHYDIACAALDRELHVLCEKPLALTKEEAERLRNKAQKTCSVAAVNFNYRYYPAIQHARGMVIENSIGKVNIISGDYLQDWLLFDTDYNWRLDPEIGGNSRAMADIGSHWCDLAQHVLGQRIIAVMADLFTVHEVRRKPVKDIETFKKANTETEYEDKPMTTEDYGGVLVRFENGAKGIFCASQVSAGQKCRIRLELYGTEKSICWNHEDANSLWIGNRDTNCEVVTKSPTDMNEQGAEIAHYPAGHPEGYPDAVKNICIDFYRSIEKGEASKMLPTFEDGYTQSQIVDAIQKSHKQQCWVNIGE